MKKDQHLDTRKYTRVELIDHTEGGEGRVFVKRAADIEVELSEQDDGQTLKIFISSSKE